MEKSFSTIMLLKCVTNKKFAEDFLNFGRIKFGTPQEWINAWKSEGSGRGDLLEGSFASITSILSSNYIKSSIYKSLRNNTIEMINPCNGHIHFQSKDVLELPTCCFFGLNDNMFKSISKGEDGIEYPTGKIKKSYFKDFAKTLDKEAYENCKENEKPAVIMIGNPREFRKRFEAYFIKNGLDLNEIIYAPVTYLNKNKEFLIDLQPPYELFVKDDKFSNQSEIRIVLNTKNKKFLKKLNENNGIIELGNMSDIAKIEGYYFEDFVMQKRGSELLYPLATPIVTPLPQDVTEFFETRKKTDTVTAYQTINGKKCSLIVERDEETGKILSIHP